MIAKAKSCPGGTALFNYVVDEKKGYELSRNGLSGATSKELYDDMVIFQQQNLRCKNNTLSIVLSPTIADSANMSKKQLEELTKDFLKAMDLNPKSNQYIAFVHTEKDHKHVHILMNRVKQDGKLIKDNFISKKAQRIAHEVALKYGYVSAKELKKEKELKSKATNLKIKQIIKDAHSKVILAKPNSLGVYQKEMAKLGVTVQPTINKQGSIQGFRFIHESTGVNLKASEVDRNLKLNELFKNETSTRILDKENDVHLQEWKTNSIALSKHISLFGATGGDEPEQDQNRKKKRKLKR